MWNFCRTHNRDYWYTRFFRPLVMLASTALGESIEPDAQPEYATSRMLFVELCPYASSQFQLGPEQVAALSKSDIGFKTAARVIDLLLAQAAPALILLNGRSTLDTFEALYAPRLQRWQEIRYPSVTKETRFLWHRQGFLDGNPVLGFPFLRKPRTHNSNAEILQLGTLAREFMTSA